jgi:integrase
MAGVDRAAPARFLATVFEPTDWIAIFLKSYETSGVAQRVGPVSWIQSDRFQRWLCAMNAQKYNIFVSVNAIALPGFRFHDLRHTVVTDLLEAGEPDHVIQAVTGQLSKKMLEHYSHQRLKAKGQMLTRMEERRKKKESA